MYPILNGKMVCLCYGPDTSPARTRRVVNKFLNYDGGWRQTHTWELGDGDPGIVVPKEIDDNDPRVLAAFAEMARQVEEGDICDKQLTNEIDITAETDDVVVLFVVADDGE